MDALAEWLKSTILGVIILGALGSLLALGIMAAARRPVQRLWKALVGQHKARTTKQAFFLGYSAHVIHDDETGRKVVTFMVYRAARFLAAVVFLAVTILALVVLLTTQAKTAATLGTVATSTLMFLTAYWAYFEYEWLHRTYLWQWQAAMKHAEAAYRDRRSRAEEDGSEATNEDDAPAQASSSEGATD